MPELSPAQAESYTTPKREKQGGLRSDPYPDTTLHDISSCILKLNRL